MDQTKIWQLLQGELSQDEEKAVHSWVRLSAQNKLEFDRLKSVWEHAGSDPRIVLADPEPAWKQIEPFIHNNSIKPFRLRSWLAVAASLFFISSIVLWFLLEPQNNMSQELYTGHNSYELTLEDSSKITMMQNSYIRYFTRISNDMNNRMVYIDGQGTFNVRSLNGLPFIVHTALTGVEALGTVFSVKQEKDSTVSVKNYEGLVKFYELKNIENAVILEEGDSVVFDGTEFNSILPEKRSFIPESGEMLTIEQIISVLFHKFDGRFNTGPYGHFDNHISIQIDLNQTLSEIIADLDKKTKMNYRKTCDNCFEIRSIESLPWIE